MKFEDLIMKAEMNPKKLFLIDGFGAILSSFLLGVVLVKFEQILGIPPPVLYFLAIIPIFFVVYDFFCFQKHNKIGLLLKGIAVLNLVYCCISIGLIFYHFSTVTILGWAYIIVDVVVITFIAMIEFRLGKKLSKPY